MLKLSIVTGVMSLKVHWPENSISGLMLIRSLSRFNKDVLPAPDAPMMKVSSPGRQYPLTPFKISNCLTDGSPRAMSSLEDCMVTANRMSLKLILHTEEPYDYCLSSLFLTVSLLSISLISEPVLLIILLSYVVSSVTSS